MKRMKTIGLLLLLLLLLSACSGDPPVGKKLVTDPNDYMHVNAYVRAQLLRISDNPLPVEIPTDTDVLEYRYTYCCGILGDPNYSIKLVLRYRDAAAFQQEVSRVRNIAVQDMSDYETPTGYAIYFGNTIEGLEMLTDDQIQDGNAAIIRYAFVDWEAQTVTYGVGQLYDGSAYDDDLIRTWEAESRE